MSLQTRRQLLALAAAMPLTHDLRQQSGGSASQLAMTLGPDDGELVYVGRDPVRIKVGPQGRQGRFGMITQDVSAGTSIPVHLPEREDEIILTEPLRASPY